MFKVELIYADNCTKRSCPSFIRPEPYLVQFTDYENKLEWGTVGFTAAGSADEEVISNLLVTPDTKDP